MDSFKDAQHAQCVAVTSVLGRVKRDTNMGLGGEVINLVRTNFAHDSDNGA